MLPFLCPDPVTSMPLFATSWGGSFDDPRSARLAVPARGPIESRRAEENTEQSCSGSGFDPARQAGG